MFKKTDDLVQEGVPYGANKNVAVHTNQVYSAL